MLIIRFSRTGKRNHPHYRVVLTEKTYPVQGKFNELLGSYNPHQKVAVLKEERIRYWLDKGVVCSDTVHNLFVSKGLIKGVKKKVRLKKEQAKAEEAKEASKKEEPEKEEKNTDQAKEIPDSQEKNKEEAASEEYKSKQE
jgi:small subunit ribosomal protein S16